MAIAKIKKIELIGLSRDKEELLKLLQVLGAVELSAATLPAAPAGSAAIAESELHRLGEAITYLCAFNPPSTLLGSLVKFKPRVEPLQLKEVISGFDYESLLSTLAQLRQRQTALGQHQEKLIQEKTLLAPWQALDLPLTELRATKLCAVTPGVLAKRNYSGLCKELAEEKINLFSAAVNQDNLNLYLVTVYLQKDAQRLAACFRNHGVNPVSLGQGSGRVKDRLREIAQEAQGLNRQIQETKHQLYALKEDQLNLMVVYDYLNNLHKAKAAEKNLAVQQFTFVLSGWIKAKDQRLIKEQITRNFKEAAIFISEPKTDEDVPVVLENPALLQPFEVLTNIYGMPKYHELDPTPFLAPFFFLFFGFCISDAGYGLMLFVLSWLIIRKFRLGPQGRRFFQLLLFCAVSTVMVGALTGSWFGNLFDLLAGTSKIFLPLKQFKDALVILDPLKQPTRLLGMALGLGIVQVWFGNIVAALGNLKNRRFLNVLLDQAPTLIFLFGLTGLGLVFLGLFGQAHLGLFKAAAVCAAAVLILTQGRAEKGLGAKLFFGLYNLYSAISGYLSDILSYSRLWALGLVTGVMANTINLLSIEFSRMLAMVFPFLQKMDFIRLFFSSLCLVIIFLVGHTLSLLMNLLGAFVHPLRLQFVEFFSKFFKTSGRAFKPFKIETKYVELSEAQTYGTQ